ncbi:BON domain-containing protein [Croceicoccus marinus]|uniref:BON domain-containing protein n=1 Tax=Croceicoccus marinus TaxID=450378 RepID=A0A1Z1FB91_9SPHN|nr:BON domain-containing protein [Croceicoccus marinus]ARU16030.1 hypothetical protein A9D14_07280 [Croceicoccus marinus]
MDNREENRNSQQNEDYRQEQPQQWDDSSYRNSDQSRTDRRDWQSFRADNYDDDKSFDRGNRFDRDERFSRNDRATRQWGGERRDRDEMRAYRGGHYDPVSDRGYGRFTSESYGGRDFSNSARAPYYGYSGGRQSGMGAQYPSPYDYDSQRHGYDRDRHGDRSFFERAGDEIASWFGDDEATRRREMDHRGNGPQGYRRSDERILEDVCDRLTEDRYVDGREITVTVEDGEVTLSGTVPQKGAKRRAEDCADHVSGVSHVQNNLRVRKNTDS